MSVLLEQDRVVSNLVSKLLEGKAISEVAHLTSLKKVLQNTDYSDRPNNAPQKYSFSQFSYDQQNTVRKTMSHTWDLNDKTLMDGTLRPTQIFGSDMSSETVLCLHTIIRPDNLPKDLLVNYETPNSSASQEGSSSHTYLDDLLHCGKSPQQVQSSVLIASDLLRALVLSINWKKKSTAALTTNLTWLGA